MAFHGEDFATFLFLFFRFSVGACQETSLASARCLCSKTGDGDGESFTLYFPCELNSTDYLRRIIAQVRRTLRPVYSHMLTARRLAKVEDSGHTIEPSDADA